MSYLFFKWLHIIAIISWMAGILYLYRLLIYHVEKGPTNKDIHELLKLMEKRLYKFITLPAMLLAWLAGLSMAFLNSNLLSFQWLQAKIILVLLLTGATIYANTLRNKFTKSLENTPTSRTLRFLNEVPTLLMMLIVALVIFRPF